MNEDDLKYPIGKFNPQESYSARDTEASIARIESLPSRLRSLVSGWSAKDLDTAYRPGGWTARQVIHHVADSHMNAYVRFKWTLTEETPVIKAYNEKLWAETGEVKLDPEISIELLGALHRKWTALLKTLKPEDLKRAYVHPDTGKHNTLEKIVSMYAWHGDHHLGHLQIVAKKKS